MRLDLSAMQHHAALSGQRLDRVAITVEAADHDVIEHVLPDPLANTFELTVPAGDARVITMTASRAGGAADAGLLRVPLFAGTTTADLPSGATVALAIPTYAVGLVQGTARITDLEVVTPGGATFELLPRQPAPGQPRSLVQPAGPYALVLPVGAYEVTGSITTNGEVFAVLEGTLWQVGHGAVLRRDVSFVREHEACRAFQPADVKALAGCQPLWVSATGLVGTGLVLENNGSFVTLPPPGGAVAFPDYLRPGESYAIEVAVSPQAPSQVCVPTDGSAAGTMLVGGVAEHFTCTTQSFAVSGVVDGLPGSTPAGLEVSVSMGTAAPQAIDAWTDFTFAAAASVLSGTEYTVAVTAQPSGGYCVPAQATGTVGGSDVTLRIVCLPDVTPLYAPGAFGDYVANDGGDIFSASGAPCTEEYGPLDACLHAGEMRAVSIPNTTLTSCAGVAVSDALGVFDWACDDTTGTVRVVSTGLASGAPLMALIDRADGSVPGGFPWRQNYVVLTAGGETRRTADARWWTNPIYETTSGAITPAAGDVHVVTQSGASPPTFTLAGAGGITVLVDDAVTLTYDGAPFVTAGGTCSPTTPGLWLEGGRVVDSAGSATGITMDCTRFARVRRMTLEGWDTALRLADATTTRVQQVDVASVTHGFVITYGYDSAFEDVAVTDATGTAIDAGDSSGLTFDAIEIAGADIGLDLRASEGGDSNVARGIRVASAAVCLRMTRQYASAVQDAGLANCGTGVVLDNVDQVSLGHVAVTNVATDAVSAAFVTSSTFVDLVLVGGTGAGVYGYEVYDSAFVGITTGMQRDDGEVAPTGVQVSGGGNVFVGVLVVNTGVGVDVSDAQSTTYRDVAVVGANAGVAGAPGTVAFDGAFVLAGNDADCAVSTSTGAEGIATAAGDGVSCELTGASTGSVASSAALVSTVVGPSADAVNGSPGAAAGGSVPYDSVASWVGFANAYRGFGAATAGQAFPHPLQRGSCAAGDPCQIYDWRLASGSPLAEASALVAVTWGGGVFLAGAYEVDGDGDFLCEEGEACLVHRNVGAFPGQGTLSATGSLLVDGITVAGYAFSTTVAP